MLESRGEEHSRGPLDSPKPLRTSVGGSLCFIRMCCLSPFSVAATYSHWSHFISKSAREFSTEILVEDSCCLLARNSSLLLAFLLRLEGLVFFLVTGLSAFFLVSKEKENPELTVKEKLKA